MKSVVASSACLLFVGLVAAGCAGMRAVEVGATQEAVRAALGAPTVQAKTSAGERWAYSSAPEGKQVWLLDFDRSRRLVSRVQGLTISRVTQVTQGQTQAEVEALIGPSYWTLRYPFRQDELVHVYRFNDAALPMCFYVGYNTSGTVSSTGMQEELRSAMMARPC